MICLIGILGAPRATLVVAFSLLPANSGKVAGTYVFYFVIL